MMAGDVDFTFLRSYDLIKGIVHTYIVFFKKLRPLFSYLWTCSNTLTFNRTDVSLFQQVNKYGKRIVLIFLYTLYKAQGKSKSSFSHSFIAVFPFSFFSNATNFGGLFHSLYMQIYILNACKLDWEEKLFDFYVESIPFRIKILMNETSI